MQGSGGRKLGCRCFKMTMLFNIEVVIVGFWILWFGRYTDFGHKTAETSIDGKYIKYISRTSSTERRQTVGTSSFWFQGLDFPTGLGPG